MNDAQLRTFIALYELGSFAKAAEVLYLSAPALKKQMDSLEKEIRVSLFIRSNRGLTPTEGGKHFYTFCKGALDALEREVEAVRALHRVDGELIRIGFDNVHVRDRIMSYALYAFKRLKANIRIETEQTTGFDPERHDLFLGAHRDCQRQTALYLLCHLPLTVVIADDHPLAGKTRIHLGELSGFPLNLPPREMLAYTEPNLPAALKAVHKQAQYCKLASSGELPLHKVLVNRSVSIRIGFEEHIVHNAQQIPLDGFFFRYEMVALEPIQKDTVQELIAFLQAYYPNKLRELSEKVYAQGQ